MTSNEINIEDPRIKLTSEGLMIHSIGSEDEGVYECMAKSAMGEAKSRPARAMFDKSKGKGNI